VVEEEKIKDGSMGMQFSDAKDRLKIKRKRCFLFPLCPPCLCGEIKK